MSFLDSSLLGPLCALSSSATWAIGSSKYSKLSRSYSAFSVNFARALVALPLFVLATVMSTGGISQAIAKYQDVKLAHWGWFTLSMTASYGLGDSLFLMSTRYLGVPAALTIASCYPAWTVFAAYVWGGIPISFHQVIGLSLSLFGIIIVILSGQKLSDSTDKKSFSFIGIFLAIATSISWATNGFAVFQAGTDLSASVGNTVRMLVALPLCYIFNQMIARGGSLILPKKVILGNFWIFIIEAFLGSYFYLYGLSHSPIALGAILASLAPVISVPVVLVLGLEKFSFFKTLGVILVVGGISLLVGTF